MEEIIIYRGFHECENGSKTIIQNDVKVHGEWIISDSIIREYGEIELFQYSVGWKFIQNGTIGFLTEKKDKNGNDIFSGDILKVKLLDCSEKFRLAVVKFGEFYDECASDTFIGFYCETEGVQISFYQEKGEWLKNAEVVGNLWENPELIKENKQ